MGFGSTDFRNGRLRSNHVNARNVPATTIPVTHPGRRLVRMFAESGILLSLTMTTLLAQLNQSKIYDLAQPYYVGMPHYPTHPPYAFALTKKHGDYVLDGGISSAADAIAFGGHVGTHIDSLCHFSCCGKLHGGIEVAGKQSYGEGVRALSVDTISPIVRRCVLLDIAALKRVDALPPDFAITPEDLEAAERAQGVRIAAGDVVLLRTGWAQYWRDAARYITGGSGAVPCGPGPEEPAAHWLSERSVFAAGSDTIGFERVPSGMRVHMHLLVESGIYIIEALNLEELARQRCHESVFAAAPLKIEGGTGSPIRPIAIAG